MLKFGTSSAETLTLSFWVKSNKTGTYIAEIITFATTKSQSSDLEKTSSLAVVPEEVANGTVKVKVLEAQRQVSLIIYLFSCVVNEIFLNSLTYNAHILCAL